MSRGSFCRSPSDVMMSRPRACSKPAANAAVWPKLRRSRITRSRGSAACRRARISNPSSVLPSSMMMISYERPQAPSVSVSSRWSSTSAGASFLIGMTTLRSGFIGAVANDTLSVLSGPLFAPEQVRREASEQNTYHRQRDHGAVLVHVGRGAVAVADRQQPERQVARAASDGDGRREPRRADADDAGEQDEDLERRRRWQDRRHQHCHCLLYTSPSPRD